jgi:aspartokinase-like uncharacterized kinase
VDVVRKLDRCHHLGEETAHHLALLAVALNARYLEALLKDKIPIVIGGAKIGALASRGLAIVNDFRFAAVDDFLPHSWEVTSDSLAARVAVHLQARRLILLKSVSIPDGLDCSEASRLEYVDRYFPRAVVAGRRNGGPPLEVRAVNLRAWQPGHPAEAVLRVGEHG